MKLNIIVVAFDDLEKKILFIFCFWIFDEAQEYSSNNKYLRISQMEFKKKQLKNIVFDWK